MAYRSIDFVPQDLQGDKPRDSRVELVLAGSQSDPSGQPYGLDTLKAVRLHHREQGDGRGEIKTLYSEGLEALGRYTQVKWVKLHGRTQGILAATDTGNVNVYASQGYDKLVEQTNAHHGMVTSMCLSPDGTRLFTAGQDGALFVFRLAEQLLNCKDRSLKALAGLDDPSMSSSAAGADKKNQGGKAASKLKIVEPELADIVLVKRNEMAEWQQRYKQLKYDLALTKKKVAMKLEECKKRFER